jgi:hypothetical protein
MVFRRGTAPLGPHRADFYTNAKYYFVQSGEGFSMQGKELERGVAALR